MLGEWFTPTRWRFTWVDKIAIEAIMVIVVRTMGGDSSGMEFAGMMETSALAPGGTSGGRIPLGSYATISGESLLSSTGTISRNVSLSIFGRPSECSGSDPPITSGMVDSTGGVMSVLGYILAGIGLIGLIAVGIGAYKTKGDKANLWKWVVAGLGALAALVLGILFLGRGSKAEVVKIE
jgi:hypothetical protein